MRCVAYHIAHSFRQNDLVRGLKNEGCQVKFYHKAMHITEPSVPGDCFVFANGSVVMWGMTRRVELALRDKLRTYATDSPAQITADYFIYRYGKRTSIATRERFNLDEIILETDQVQLKLAISYGLAQSVRLEMYEEIILTTIKNNHHLTQELAKKGEIALSREEISRRMGEIFMERSSINLNSEDVDVSKYFWKYPSFESYYLLTQEFLDMPGRIAALNQKLDVLHEILDMLKSQLEHRHSSILEYTIILLILMEIIFNFFHISLR